VTIRHLLTHTAGLPNADAVVEGTPWRESRAICLARMYAAPRAYEPGTRAGYHAGAGMPTDRYEAYGDRIGRERHQARLDAVSSAVYVDLRLASPDDPGRAKPFPTVGL
jgi:hypothetical protein